MAVPWVLTKLCQALFVELEQQPILTQEKTLVTQPES